jgi:hypothetical protein
MLTEAKVKAIHKDITEALQLIAKAHGLTLSPTSIRYNPTTFKLSAQFGDSAETGGVDPKLLFNLKRNGWKFGLTEAHLGKTFSTPRHGNFTFEGFTGRSKCAVKDGNGKMFRMNADQVAQYFGEKPVGGNILDAFLTPADRS